MTVIQINCVQNRTADNKIIRILCFNFVIYMFFYSPCTSLFGVI